MVRLGRGKEVFQPYDFLKSSQGLKIGLNIKMYDDLSLIYLPLCINNNKRACSNPDV
jgi:hypothetical protein